MKHFKKYFPTSIVILFGIIITLVLYNYEKSIQYSNQVSEFEKETINQKNAIEKEINSLTTVINIFQHNWNLKRNEFQKITEPLLHTNPCIKSISWAIKLNEENQKSVIKKLKEDGYSDSYIEEKITNNKFVLTKPEDTYFPICYIEPLNTNSQFIGYSINSNYITKEVLEIAINENRLSFSQCYRKDENDVWKFLMALPVYNTFDDLSQLESRKKHLTGFVIFVVELEKMINNSLTFINKQQNELLIFDVSDSIYHPIIYGSLNPNSDTLKIKSFDYKINLGEKKLNLQFNLPEQIIGKNNSIKFLITGILISLIIGMYIFRFTSRAEKARLFSLKLQNEIAEKNKLQYKLLEESEKFNVILSTTSDGFWILDYKGFILDCNENYSRMSGYSIEELKQMHITDLEDNEKPEQTKIHVQNVIANGYDIFQTQHKTKTGSIINVEIRTSYWEDNKQFFVFVHDISNRVEATKKLKEAKNIQAKILNAFDDGTYLCSPDYDILYLNPAMIKQIGYDATGEKCYQAIYNSNEICQWCYFEGQKLNKNEKISIEIEKDNKTFLVTSLLNSDNSKLTVYHDITQHKSIETEIKEKSLYLTKAQQIGSFGSYSLDIKTGIWECSEYLEYIFDIDQNFKKDIEGWTSIIHSDYRENISNYFQNEVIGQKKNFDKIYPILTIIGKQKKWVHGTGQLEFDEHGNPIKMIGVIQDISDRREYEEKLEESEAKYRLTFNTSPDAININTIDGIYIDVNEGFLNLTGYNRDEVIGKSSSEIDIWSIPEDRIKLVDGLKKYGVVKNLESEFKCKDGSIKTALMSARIIELDGVPHISSITRDITARKIAETELQKHQYYLEKAQSIGQIGTWEIDILSNEIIWTKENYKIFGLPIGMKMKYDTFLEKIHPDDKEYVNLEWINGIKGNNYDIEHRIIVEGQIKWVREKADFIFDDNKRCIKAIGVTQDITKLKKSEIEIKKLFTSVEQSASTIVITDIQGSIEYVNKAFTETTGYIPEEAIGNNPRVLKSGKHNNEFYKNMWETISSGDIWKGELINKKKNGELFWESASISPIFNDKNNIINYIAIKEDITNKKQLDQKILKTIIDTEEKERSRFAEDLHDELGPFLSGIKLYIKELAYEDVDFEKRLSIIEYLNDFINSAVEKTRSISNQLMPNILNDYGLKSAINSFCSKINNTKTIQINFNSNISEAGFDKTIEVIIYRITIELINNTIKHAKAKTIDIGLNQNDSNVKLIYTDDGIGFNLEEMQKLEKGMGLNNILRRLNSVGGNYQFSRIGKGILFEFEFDLSVII